MMKENSNIKNQNINHWRTIYDKRSKEQTQSKDKEASDNYDRQEDTIYEDEKSIKYGHDEKKENKNVSTKTIGTVDNQSHNKKTK